MMITYVIFNKTVRGHPINLTVHFLSTRAIANYFTTPSTTGPSVAFTCPYGLSTTVNMLWLRVSEVNFDGWDLTNSISSLSTIFPLSFISTAIGPDHATLSTSLIVDVLALIYISTSPAKGSCSSTFFCRRYLHILSWNVPELPVYTFTHFCFLN